MPFRRNVAETLILPEGSPAAGALLPWLHRCDPLDRTDALPVAVVDPASVGPDVLDGFLADASRGAMGLIVAVPPDGGSLSEDVMRTVGASAGTTLPAHPVRLEAAPGWEAVTARLEPLIEPRTPVVPLLPSGGATVAVLTAPVGLRRVPVVTWNASAGVMLLGVSPDALVEGHDDRGCRLFHRLLLIASHGAVPERPLPKVGLLGFGAIGSEHVAGFAAAGFEIAAVCDRSEERLRAVSAMVPGVATYAKADELMGSADLGLVAISTPPDSHASWATAAISAGHHAVVEKPLALSAAEADTMLDAAESAGLTLAVYQNRRFDPDFLAIQRLVREGRLGRVFRVEAFVGGFSHPCNYWHSEASVSGGTAFDWGSHYLDQILAVIPSRPSWVRGSAHKLRWHDVTNADQVAIDIRFDDGTEAQFIHSDIAAALKPKWYILGTEGAVVGEWRQERVLSRTAIGLLNEDRLAPADSPADVWLHHPDGSRTQIAAPGPSTGRYHLELADRLSLGEPLTADPDQSRDVVAILEAASVSAAGDGRAQFPAMRGR